MRIYLAGGFSVMNVVGREEELLNHFPRWRRLVSFYFLDVWDKGLLAILKRGGAINESQAKRLGDWS